MMKILVTGANGFIGSHLLDVITKDGHEVIAIIKDKNEKIDSIKDLSNVRIVYCELNDLESLPSKISDRDIDICIHLAWAGSSGDARADYALQLSNVKYALDMVKVSKEMNIKRYVGAGTLAEKDVLNYHPTDGATPNAVSIYGIAKVAMHFMTKAECNALGIEHVWCYLSNTYGEGNTTGNFINFLCASFMKGVSPALTNGTQLYDFVHVKDTARAIFAVSQKGVNNNSYYLGSGNPMPLKDYIIQVRNIIDPKIKLRLGDIPFNGISLNVKELDASKLIKEMDFKPLFDFETGIKETLGAMKD